MDNEEGRDATRGQAKEQQSTDAETVAPSSAPNVALIAIHGVGQHLSGASADAVSTLLMSIEREKVVTNGEKEGEGTPPYSGFVATSIDVPVRPLQAPQLYPNQANCRKDGNWLRRLWSIFDERRGYLAETRADPNAEPYGYSKEELRPGEPDRGEFAYQFMLTQVAGYKGEVNRDFQTVRLEGKRRANSPAATVHIYDAHYSDLTKPQSNILSFFFAFYQLLFHLAHLSLLAVYWAETENVQADPQRTWRWRVKSSVSATAVRFLTMWIPCLNLILLAIAASALTAKAEGQIIPLGFAALLSLIATFYFLWRVSARSPLHAFLWATVPLLGTALGMLFLSGCACLYGHLVGVPCWETLLLLCWLLTAGLLLAGIAWKFEQLRPGVFRLTIALYVLNAVFFLAYLLPQAVIAEPNSQYQVPTAALWAVQWIFGELSLAWITCLLSALISWPLGVLCLRAIPEAETDRRARAIAAFRTGRFAFAVPAVLFMIVTTVLWAGAIAYGSEKLKAFEGVQPCVVQNGLSNKWPSFIIPQVVRVQEWIDTAKLEKSSGLAKGDEKTPSTETCNRPNLTCTLVADCHCVRPIDASALWFDYLRGLLLVSVTPGLPITLTLFVLSLLLLTWAVFPSVIYEAKPDLTKDAVTDRIRWLGSWLSRGLDNTAILTRVLWLGIVPLPLVFFAIDWLVLRDYYPGLSTQIYHVSNWTWRLISGAGLFVVVSGAAVFGGALKGFTSVLDAILDVDNYLRTSPLDQTPRARVAERCVSLLRYVAAYRDEQGRPYSKVIFVAHSLGSMVTTDLLRYLERSAKSSPDPGLARYGFRGHPIPTDESKLPIYVFSMGSPLRQLLNRFFPHLYWWVSDVPDNSLSDVGKPLAPPPAIGALTLPRVDEMNVTRWTNAYRSGDYIGRSLWVGQWLTRNKVNNPALAPDIARAGALLSPSCEEMCIGLGAHTHYWDRSAPDIAKALDGLII